MKFYILLVLEVWTELIRSSDNHCSYFLLSGGQDFADFEEKKRQFVQFTEMSISLEPFELHTWFFAGNQVLQRGIMKKKWYSEDESNHPNQPNQPSRWKNEKVAYFLNELSDLAEILHGSSWRGSISLVLRKTWQKKI